ncbi:MAG: PKD domain-containing protein [Planctomycetes bacterium]|nr:PKD domain-containing protein [Planctomycetota bacterium]
MQRPFASILVTTLAAVAAAQTVVVPNGTATTEGGATTAYAWGRGSAQIRCQYIFDSTHFTAQGITFPITINQLQFRANGGATTAGYTYNNAYVALSTAAVDYTAPSTTFASNHGPNLATVYSGPVVVASGAGTTPNNWYVTIPCAPFLYDPTAGGDLCLELAHDGTGPGTTTGPAHDCMTTGSLSSRVYNLTNWTSATGSTQQNVGIVTEFGYTPASGLYAGFTATPTAGASPLTVSFTDRSFSSSPGGVLAWAWDLDGDSVIDSTVQNPTWVYGCGTYTVSLTVFDSTFPPSTLTKTGFIVVDTIAANFTASPIGGFAPATVNFTDTSTGPVLAWAWDFDGDNVIDSTVQNPTWVYGAPGQYTVSLTVTNSCRTNTRTRTNLITVLAPGTLPAPAELLQYQFNEVRGTEVGNSAATNAAPRQATMNATNWWSDPGRPGFRGNEPGFGCLGYRATGAGRADTGWPTSITGSFTISFWLMRDPASTGSSPFGYPFGNGTFRSFTGSAGIFFDGSSLGSVTSSFTVHLTPGVWQHLALVVDDQAGQALWYSNGVPSTNVRSFTPNTFSYSSTANFAVGANGTGGTSPIGAHFHLDDFRFYTRALTPAELLINALTVEQAAASVSGLSCPGTLGTPVIGSTGGAPAQGNANFALTLGNAENQRLAALAVGLTPAAFGTFDLSPWLGAGCVLQNDAIALNFYVVSGNAVTQPFPIPAAGFAGQHFYAQWAVLGTVGAATRMLDINIQ